MGDIHVEILRHFVSAGKSSLAHVPVYNISALAPDHRMDIIYLLNTQAHTRSFFSSNPHSHLHFYPFP
jgi:hypothetical protein